MSTFYGGEQLVSVSRQSKPLYTTAALSYTAPTGFYARVKYHITQTNSSSGVITVTVDGVVIDTLKGTIAGSSHSDEVVVPSGVNISTDSMNNDEAAYFSIEVYKNP